MRLHLYFAAKRACPGNWYKTINRNIFRPSRLSHALAAFVLRLERPGNRRQVYYTSWTIFPRALIYRGFNYRFEEDDHVLPGQGHCQSEEESTGRGYITGHSICMLNSST
ncbi:hypothetical protein L596_001871 [Steinernema carpocapsae]|uniref:Uncharacterized protein n=1 Tax=Steinernema carpocapsae TaxID=34508 RepID=A0A4U8URD1_STECR|nr:hypothetical protein L596_001871 [Steinernema carpocapsae]